MSKGEANAHRALGPTGQYVLESSRVEANAQVVEVQFARSGVCGSGLTEANVFAGWIQNLNFVLVVEVA